MLGIVQPAWEEFSDLEESEAGVALMLQMATGHNFLQEHAEALVWLERLLPIAERLDLLEATATGLSRLAGTLWRVDRQRESLILLRGAHQLAVENDLVDVHRNTRTSLSFREQFADPAAGLALAREGLEIASRSGSTSYGFMMVGNAMSCALRAGEWDWAAALLEDWLSNEITGSFYLELYRRPGGADRAPRRRPIRRTSPRPSASWSTSWAIPSTRRTSTGRGPGRRSAPADSTRRATRPAPRPT